MALQDRIKQWNFFTEHTPVHPEPDVVAGQKSEEKLTRLANSKIKYKKIVCFVGKRFPNIDRGRGRYEIDLIIITHKQIHLIEVKNWSGSLSIDGGNWIQHRRNGESIVHENIIELNDRKIRSLSEYFRASGLGIPRDLFSHRIIFVNEKLILPKELERNWLVVKANGLEEYFDSSKYSSKAERFVHSIVDFCFAAEKGEKILLKTTGSLTNRTFKSAVKKLDQLESWDKVLYRGDRVETGDLLNLRSSSVVIDFKKLPSGLICKIKWPNINIYNMVMAIVFSSKFGKIRVLRKSYKIKPTDTVFFHKAGSKTPEEISVRDISELIRG